MRTLAWSCGLIGGAVWVVRAVLDAAGSLDVGPDAILGAVLLWVGAALLAAAVLALGLDLVDRAPAWLRVVVAVGVVALAGSVLLVLHGDGDGILVDGVVGAVAVVLAGLALARRSRRPRKAGADRPTGSSSPPSGARRAGQRRASGSHAR